MLRVAVNGYGRIGRLAHRIILEKHSQEIEVVAINASSSTDIKGWTYLLKYDTSYGILSSKFKVQSSKLNDGEKIRVLKDAIGYLIINNQKLPVFSQKDPSLLPWKDLNVDVVIESTGKFTTEEKLNAHLVGGAKKVILSAPLKEGNVPTYILCVNAQDYQGEALISNASCTTNCIAPVVKIMLDNFGVKSAMMTTIHGYTSDQRLQDGGHKDYRRGRAAAQNIVPTSTGADSACAKVLPELLGSFQGLAIRVPVATGSLSDLTFILKKNVTVEEVNEVFKKEADNTIYKNRVVVTEDPLVSSDIIGNPASAIVDISLTQVVSGNMVKVIAWYDNEYGYANRLVEEVVMVGNYVLR